MLFKIYAEKIAQEITQIVELMADSYLAVLLLPVGSRLRERWVSLAGVTMTLGQPSL